MEPIPDTDLLQSLLNPREDGRGGQDSRELVRRAESQPPVLTAFRELSRAVPTDDPEDLSGFLRYALLGVSVGFIERNLSPYLAEHVEIIPPLLEDIRSVFRRLKKMRATYEEEEFRYRAFDYGLHKAYYLDWRLYMSKELY